jgi:hypothetical protein
MTKHSSFNIKTKIPPRQTLPATTMRLSFTITSSFFIAVVSASNVLDLTPENFDKVVGQGKPALVELYVPFGVLLALIKVTDVRCPALLLGGVFSFSMFLKTSQ